MACIIVHRLRQDKIKTLLLRVLNMDHLVQCSPVWILLSALGIILTCWIVYGVVQTRPHPPDVDTGPVPELSSVEQNS